MSQWSLAHTPAASAQATISQAAAAAGVRNVCESVSFCMSATTALAGISTVTVNLRDGATGAGAILKSWQFTLPAAVLLPLVFSITGLHIIGSAATAMTLEFAAAVGNLMEAVTIDGYTQP